VTPNPTKLRALADAMQKDIDSKFHPATALQNLTQRRIRVIDGMRRDGERLQLIQSAMRAMADWHEGAGPRAAGAAFAQLATRQGFASRSTAELQTLVAPAKPDPMLEIRRMEHELVGAKIPGFFPTPAKLGAEVVRLAQLEPGQTVLEPGAGKGDLADLVRALHSNPPDTCEINFRLRQLLEAKGHRLVASDVYDLRSGTYDRIVMNPPFEKGEDARQVQHCFDHLLAPGGRLVSIVGAGILSSERGKSFRAWLDARDARVIDCEPQPFAGAASFRQTGVNVKIIVLDKPLVSTVVHITSSHSPRRTPVQAATQARIDEGLRTHDLTMTPRRAAALKAAATRRARLAAATSTAN
jgi:hypothetical protein